MEEQFAFVPVSAPKIRRPEFGAGFWLRAVARIIDMAVHWRFLFVFLLAVCADGIVSLMGVVIKMILM